MARRGSTLKAVVRVAKSIDRAHKQHLRETARQHKQAEREAYTEKSIPYNHW